MKAKIVIFLIRFFALFSLRSQQRIGAWLGALAWRLPGRSAHVTQVNLEKCWPELSDPQREQLARDSMRETGKTALEMAMAWGWSTEKALATIRRVEGEDLVQEALAQGKGLVLLGPHLGNWELVGLYLSSRFQMAALYEPPKLKEFESFMIDQRSRMGSELVPTNKRGVMRLLQILKGGGVIAILPDQEPDLAGGEFAPFFGVQANSIKLVSKLINKTGAQALCVFAKRLPDGRGFDICFRPVDAQLYSPDLATSVAGLNLSVEHCVREIPEQYQWEYKRFKKRPPGEARFYDRR